MERREQIKQWLKEVLAQNLPDVSYRAFIFGSQANKAELKRSDIDVGILADSAIPFTKIAQINNAIDELAMLYNVDMVDFNTVDERFKTAAMQNVEWFMSDYFEEKLATFEQALKTFKEALLDNPSQLERDGAIQRFEYCYDLAWKTLKRTLEKRGLFDLNSPKAVFAAAYAEKFIDDEVTWSVIITKRNMSVHTYNQKLADSLFAELPLYYKEMHLLLLKMKE